MYLQPCLSICSTFQVFNENFIAEVLKEFQNDYKGAPGLWRAVLFPNNHSNLTLVARYPCDFPPDYQEIRKYQWGFYDPVIVKERKRKELVRDYIWNLCPFISSSLQPWYTSDGYGYHKLTTCGIIKYRPMHDMTWLIDSMLFFLL